MSQKVYQIITNKIIEKLEAGTVPWRKPFQKGVAVNWKTQKPYRGINTLLLDGGEYASKKQIQEQGGRIKKEEWKNYHIAVFWKWLEIEDQETGEEKEIPFLRYYKVWEINSQVTGLESKRSYETYEHNPIEEAEKMKEGYVNAPFYSSISGGAWYKPSLDQVNIPPMKDFKSIHEYYSTLFHEMVHSTGHDSRLNREGIVMYHGFGSETYSKEELVAELGASMLCGVTGIDNHTLDNSASYIESWLRALKDDYTLIVKASQQAQKACDYIQGITYDK
jgi:antirestriction protein ArdC